MVSAILRRKVRSVLKKKLRATCIEIVLPPWTRAPWRKSAQAAPRIRIGIESGMLEKAPVLHGKHGIAQALLEYR